MHWEVGSHSGRLPDKKKSGNRWTSFLEGKLLVAEQESVHQVVPSVGAEAEKVAPDLARNLLGLHHRTQVFFGIHPCLLREV